MRRISIESFGGVESKVECSVAVEGELLGGGQALDRWEAMSLRISFMLMELFHV